MRRLLVALSSVAILAAACGGGSSPIAAPTTTASAAPAVVAGNGEIPAGFPMPVPDWAEVATVTQDDSSGTQAYTIQLLVDSSRKDEAMDIYRAFYSDQGMTIDDAGDFISGQNADVFSAVIATDSGGSTIVILSWGPS